MQNLLFKPIENKCFLVLPINTAYFGCENYAFTRSAPLTQWYLSFGDWAGENTLADLSFCTGFSFPPVHFTLIRFCCWRFCWLWRPLVKLDFVVRWLVYCCNLAASMLLRLFCSSKALSIFRLWALFSTCPSLNSAIVKWDPIDSPNLK